MNEDERTTLAALYLRHAEVSLASNHLEATVRAMGDALRTLIALAGPTTVALGLAPFGAAPAQAQGGQRAGVAAASPATLALGAGADAWTSSLKGVTISREDAHPVFRLGED